MTRDIGDAHSLSALPPGLLVAIAVLGALELALDVVALVVLVRTPADRVSLPKWAWALLIVLVNLIGSILFLAIGRRPVAAPPPESRAEPRPRPPASAVADALYGASTAERPTPSAPPVAPAAPHDAPEGGPR